MGSLRRLRAEIQKRYGPLFPNCMTLLRNSSLNSPAQLNVRASDILFGFALPLLHTTPLMHLEIKLSATLFVSRRALVYNGPQFLFPIINRSLWLHDHLHTWCRECCKKATFKSFCKLISLFKGRPTHTFWSNCSELISVWMVWFVAQATCNLQSFCLFGFLRQLAKDWCNPMPWVWWGRQGFRWIVQL